jgi:hypothetical protein
MKDKPIKSFTRRNFIKGAGASLALFTIVPRHVLGGVGYIPPSDKLNIAGVGVGGRGRDILNGAYNKGAENIVALCDVDDLRAADTYKDYPNAKRYRDFRKMLDEQKDIDAVMIATPDHTHAVVAMAAMQMGKHVYVEKPLTHNIREARMLTEAARRYNVATQMGNQGNSSEDIRRIAEWIQEESLVKCEAYRHGQIAPSGHRVNPFLRVVQKFLPLWTGTYGSVRRLCALIAPITCRSNGAVGGTLAQARLATWLATS